MMPVEFLNDKWWHEHWEMYLGFGTAIVITLVTTLRLVLSKYATKHFVKMTIHACREDVEVTDTDIIRRQEKCATDLNASIERLEQKIDRAIECYSKKTDDIYKTLLGLHEK